MARVDKDVAGLFDVADRITAIARQLRAADSRLHEALTPLETSVMRHIDRHPGSSARAAADGSLLTSSNFSRALRSLEQKGYVRRETDDRDARGVRLYPTELAGENLRSLHERWGALLDGIFDDPAELQALVDSLTRVEDALDARRASGR